jgi:hypothetical protein
LRSRIIDLFEPRLPNDKLHRSFNEIRNNTRYAKVVPVIQSWATGILDPKR